MPWRLPGRGAWTFQNVTKGFTFTPTLSSILISQELPDLTAVLSCRVVWVSGETFDNEDEVRATFAGEYGTERIFAGHLNEVGEDQSDEFGPRIWELSAQDYTAKLGDAIITRTRRRKREKAIRRVRWILDQLERRVWDLASRDLSDLPDGYVEAYDYYGATVDEALRHVADELRLHYYIDFDNVFRAYRLEARAAPFGLDNDAPDYAATFPFREWHRVEESTELANAVLVEPEKRRHARWSKDSTSITAYGRQERFVSDANLEGASQATNVGGRTVDAVKDPDDEATVVVYHPGLQAGMKLHVVEGLWGHDFDRYIRRVEIRAVDPEDPAGEAYLRTEATLGPKWKRRRRRGQSVNRVARKRFGLVANTRKQRLDGFSRVVSPPTMVAGGAVGTPIDTAEAQWIALADYATGAVAAPVFSFGAAAIKRVESWIGANQYPWTARPAWLGCGGLEFGFAGWVEKERWYYFTIPAHPGSMAGIKMTFTTGTSPLGIGAEVVVKGDAPTALEQGTLIGEVPYDGSVDLIIPAAHVPAEGGVIYVGLRPKWACNYGATACGWNWPFVYGWENSARLAVSGSTTVWMTWSVTSPALGVTETGHTWRDAGVIGAPVSGIDGEAYYVTSAP